MVITREFTLCGIFQNCCRWQCPHCMDAVPVFGYWWATMALLVQFLTPSGLRCRNGPALQTGGQPRVREAAAPARRWGFRSEPSAGVSDMPPRQRSMRQGILQRNAVVEKRPSAAGLLLNKNGTAFRPAFVLQLYRLCQMLRVNAFLFLREGPLHFSTGSSGTAAAHKPRQAKATGETEAFVLRGGRPSIKTDAASASRGPHCFVCLAFH
jgi:hypothetical protein